MCRLYTYVAVFLCAVSTSFVACCAEESSPEAGSSVLATARQWVLAEGRELDEWTPEQLLGAAELLYWTAENSPDASQSKFVARVVARLSKMAEGSEGAHLRESLLRARLIWLLMRDNRASNEYFGTAKWLTERDSDNAIAWVLLGESSWLRGNFRTFVVACDKVDTTKVATLHSQHYRRSISAILEKAGQGTIEAKRALLLKPLPYSTYAMFLRHLSLLNSVPKVAGIIGIKGDHRRLVLRYLVLSTLSMPVGQAFDLNALAILDQTVPETGDAAVKSLLRKQQRLLAAETAEVERGAKHGTPGEVDQIIQKPGRIREQVLKARKNATTSLSTAKWLKLLSGMQEGDAGDLPSGPGSPVGPAIGGHYTVR